jgi:hypothetical protein
MIYASRAEMCDVFSGRKRVVKDSKDSTRIAELRGAAAYMLQAGARHKVEPRMKPTV